MSEQEAFDSKEKELKEKLDRLVEERNKTFIGRCFKSSTNENILYRIIGISESGNPLTIALSYDRENPAIAYNEELEGVTPSEDVEITEQSFTKVVNQILAIVSTRVYETLRKKAEQ